MVYIDDIIKYIEKNISSIPIKEVDELCRNFNISTSTFRRNFKRQTEFTPRYYLMCRKIELAQSYKLDDPTITIKEVVIKIGWDLTERQFAELFKVQYGMTFGGKTINTNEIPERMNEQEEMSIENDFMFSKERELLEEIIFRMVLVTEEYMVLSEGELCKTVRFDMENTCFRLPLFAFEKELIFRLFFDRNNFGRIDLFALFTRVGESTHAFIPNDRSPYLNLIYNVAIKQSENIKDEILGSISNWDEMIEGEKGFIFDDYRQHSYRKGVRTQINMNAGLFKRSQVNYESIIKEFKHEYEMLLNKLDLNEPQLSKYIQALNEENRSMIISTVESVCKIGEEILLPQKLDLLLRLAEYPDMQFIEFTEYSFNMCEDVISEVLEEYKTEDIPQLVYEYYYAYRNQEDEDDGEYYGDVILSNIMEEYILKKED